MSKKLKPLSHYEWMVEMNKAQEDFEAKKNELRDRLVLFQSSCKHAKTTYYPDPSGNNDSFTSCDLCDKVIK